MALVDNNGGEAAWAMLQALANQRSQMPPPPPQQRRVKNNGDPLGRCWIRECKRNRILKNVDPKSGSEVGYISCSPDCGKIVLHEECADKWVWEKKEAVPSFLQCPECGGRLELKPEKRGVLMVLGVLWKVFVAPWRPFFLYLVLPVLALMMIWRIWWYVGVVSGRLEVDQDANPWVTIDPRDGTSAIGLGILQFFRYTFVYRSSRFDTGNEKMDRTMNRLNYAFAGEPGRPLCTYGWRPTLMVCDWGQQLVIYGAGMLTCAILWYVLLACSYMCCCGCCRRSASKLKRDISEVWNPPRRFRRAN